MFNTTSPTFLQIDGRHHTQTVDCSTCWRDPRLYVHLVPSLIWCPSFLAWKQEHQTEQRQAMGSLDYQILFPSLLQVQPMPFNIIKDTTVQRATRLKHFAYCCCDGESGGQEAESAISANPHLYRPINTMNCRLPNHRKSINRSVCHLKPPPAGKTAISPKATAMDFSNSVYCRMRLSSSMTNTASKKHQRHF